MAISASPFRVNVIRRPALAAATIVAIVTAALATFRAGDPDLGFHFATGRAVLLMHRVPGTNLLSFTQTDHEWLLHQWAPATLFEIVRVVAGIQGVVLLKVCVVVVTWLVVLAASWRAAGDGASARLGALLMTLLAAAASAFRFVERPFLFTNLAMAIVAFAIVSYDGAPNRGRWRLLLLAGITAAVVSHLHAGAVNTYAMILAGAFGALVELPRARFLGSGALAPSGGRDALLFASTALAAFAIAAVTLALYNPHGVRVLGVPFMMITDAYQAEHLIEFRPPWLFPLPLLAPFWLFVAVAVSAILLGLRRVHVSLLAIVGVLLAFTLRHARVAYDLAVVAAPVAAAGAGAVLDRVDFRWTRIGIALAVACISIGGPIHNWTYRAPGLGYDERSFAVPFIDAVLRRDIHGPAYVSDGWAGPFLGALYPRERSFFDARLEAYDPAFVRDVYQRIRYGEPGWSQLLDHYDIQLVLMKYTSPGERNFQHSKDNVRQLLVYDPHWVLVAFDDTGELFVRVDGVNAKVAQSDAIPWVDPDRLALPQPPRAAWPGLARALERPPRSVRLLLLASIASADAGEGGRAAALLREARERAPDDEQLQHVVDALSRVGGAGVSP